MMKLKILFSLFLITSVFNIEAQKQYWGKYTKQFGSKITVSPDGDVFFVEKHSPLQKLNKQEGVLEKQYIHTEAIQAETLLFVSNRKWVALNTTSTSYRTSDAGKTWTKIVFPKNVNYTFFADFSNGTIWVFSEQQQQLYYSSDAGNTWKKHPDFKLKNKDDYPLFVRFEKEGNGGLLFTGETYKLYKIKKGESSIGEEVPVIIDGNLIEIDSPLKQLEIGGNYYIINIFEKIFYTNKNNIQWKLLEDSAYVIKHTDNRILTVNSNGSLSFYDSQGLKIWNYHEPWLDSLYIISIDFLNDTVFIHTTDNVYIITPSSIQKQTLYQKENPIQIPLENLVFEFNKNSYSYDNDELFQMDSLKMQWKRIKIFPFTIDNLNYYQDKLIIQSSEGFFELNMEDLSFNPYQFPKNIIYNTKINKAVINKNIISRCYLNPNEEVFDSSFFNSEKKKQILEQIAFIINHEKPKEAESGYFSFSSNEVENYLKRWQEDGYRGWKKDGKVSDFYIETLVEKLKSLTREDISTILKHNKSKSLDVILELELGSLELVFEDGLKVKFSSATYYVSHKIKIQFLTSIYINGFYIGFESEKLPLLLSNLLDGKFIHPDFTDKYQLFLHCVDYFISSELE